MGCIYPFQNPRVSEEEFGQPLLENVDPVKIALKTFDIKIKGSTGSIIWLRKWKGNSDFFGSRVIFPRRLALYDHGLPGPIGVWHIP
jgi:hypothetical protein